ncbi:hypothetical protein ACQEVF_49915 [Nonomuraea polychroma]|uniref:hypothetical protein n=1 Tax=Nonomuraea polychroma TaxID=46176 RepID=UPI003D8EAFCF
MDVAFQKRLLPTRSEDPVHGLARIRQAEGEQHQLDLLTGQPNGHVPEMDLRFDTRLVRLRHERLRWATTPSSSLARAATATRSWPSAFSTDQIDTIRRRISESSHR